MKALFIFLVIINFIFGYKIDNSFGFVRDKYGSFKNVDYRIYEYEDGYIGRVKPTWLCIESAGATAIGIRIGKKLSLKKVVNYLKSMYNYNSSPNMNDWINASNKYHLKDLNVKAVFFKDMNSFFLKVKNYIDNDFPITLLLKRYRANLTSYFIYKIFPDSLDKAIYNEFINTLNVKNIFSQFYFWCNDWCINIFYPYYSKLTIADRFEKDVNHSVTVVGYIKTRDTTYYAIRDPFIERCNYEENYFCDYFDYLVSEEILARNLASNIFLVFKSLSNSEKIVQEFCDDN